MKDIVEFYNAVKAAQNEPRSLMAQVESSMVPPVGSFISILGKTWSVSAVTYALDHSADPQKKMRACVFCELVSN